MIQKPALWAKVHFKGGCVKVDFEFRNHDLSVVYPGFWKFRVLLKDHFNNLGFQKFNLNPKLLNNSV